MRCDSTCRRPRSERKSIIRFRCTGRLAFASLSYAEGSLPESERAARETLALPIFPELEPAEIETVVWRIGEFFGIRRPPTPSARRSAALCQHGDRGIADVIATCVGLAAKWWAGGRGDLVPPTRHTRTAGGEQCHTRSVHRQAGNHYGQLVLGLVGPAARPAYHQ